MSLVNLIARKEVVKELIGDLFTVENIRKELNRLLYAEKYRNGMVNNYREIQENLGPPGAARKAAEEMQKSLKAEKETISSQ